MRADSAIAAGVTALVGRVHALEIERTKFVFYQRRDFGCKPRHLGFIVADDQVDRIRFALRELLANRLRRGGWHGEYRMRNV